MATTRVARSPLKPPLVWPQNAAYTSEAGKKTHVRPEVNDRRELISSISALEAMHRKEVESFQENKPSLETSMLAYSEKMKKISTDRRLLSERQVQSSIVSESSGQADSIFARLLTKRKLAPAALSSSFDSGDENIDEASDEDNASYSKDVGRSGFPGKVMQRRISKTGVSSVDSSAGGSNPSVKGYHYDLRVPKKTNISSSYLLSKDVIPPNRLSKPKHKTGAIGLNGANESSDRPSEDATSELLAITPFPELQRLGSPADGFNATSDTDADRRHATESRALETSKKKLPRKQDDYWSYRHVLTHRQYGKANIGKTHSHPPQHLPGNATSGSPVFFRRKYRPPPPAPRQPRKSFHHSFRYSDAVQNVIKSIDESNDDGGDESTLQRASEILPSLDITSLRLDRSRRQKNEKAAKVKVNKVSMVNTDTLPTEDHISDIDSSPHPRERSFSVPNIVVEDCEPVNAGQRPFSEKDVPSLETGRDGDGDFLSVSSRKSVQFTLPESADTSHEHTARELET